MPLKMKISPFLRIFVFLSAFYVVSINGKMQCITVRDCEEFVYPEYEIDTKCDRNICQCFVGRNPLKCYKKTDDMSDSVYGKCPCGMPFTECHDGVCYCKEGYRPSFDMRRCIPIIVSFGNRCQTDEQCQELDTFTVCNNTKCDCRKGFGRTAEGRCHSVIAKWEVCHNNVECYRPYPHTVCDGRLRRCVCEEGYIYEDTAPKNSFETNAPDCLKNADWGEPCRVDAQCQEKLGIGGFCDHYNECRCKESYLLKWMQLQPFFESTENVSNTRYECVRPIDLGDFCAVDEDCNEVKERNHTMHCFLHQCKCKFGYESKDSLACSLSRGPLLIVPMRFVFLGVIFCILTHLYHFVFLISTTLVLQ